MITSRDCFRRHDPDIHSRNFKRIQSNIVPILDDNEISSFVIGTGKRFIKLHETIVEVKPNLASVPVVYSPFCGFADIAFDDKVILADGTISTLDQYHDLTSSCFDAWKFIRSYPSRTLFCTGKMLLAALLSDVGDDVVAEDVVAEEGGSYKILDNFGIDCRRRSLWKIS